MVKSNSKSNIVLTIITILIVILILAFITRMIYVCLTEHFDNKLQELSQQNSDKKDVKNSKEMYRNFGWEIKPSPSPNQWYPDLILPPQVIGCGGRREGCLGGSQIPIPTIDQRVDISDRNIAPSLYTTIDDNNMLHQVGVIQKILANENDVYPLFGRKNSYNRNRYEYFTMLGPANVYIRVLQRNSNNEIGTNEIVKIEGNSANYRAVIYDNNFPRVF